MDTFIQVTTPKNTAELRQGLADVDRQITDLWNRIGPEEFFATPADGGWSPARNLSHLALGTNVVTMSLKLPRFVPRLLFGRTSTPSRSYEEIRDKYTAKLATGAGAGPFTPRKRAIPKDPASERERLITRWRGVVPALLAAMDGWDDAALDRYRLLHPLIGRLTVREMLGFTLYHLSRHSEIVARRMAGGKSTASSTSNLGQRDAGVD